MSWITHSNLVPELLIRKVRQNLAGAELMVSSALTSSYVPSVSGPPVALCEIVATKVAEIGDEVFSKVPQPAPSCASCESFGGPSPPRSKPSPSAASTSGGVASPGPSGPDRSASRWSVRCLYADHCISAHIAECVRIGVPP